MIQRFIVDDSTIHNKRFVAAQIPVVYGLAWAVTESLLQRLVPLWVGARSLQFRSYLTKVSIK